MAGGWNHALLANPVPGDIVKALLDLGIAVRKVDNGEAQAPCPAHYERTGKAHSVGDWSVNVEDGMHNCFSCGFSGYFVDVVIQVLGSSREEAVAWCRERGSLDRARRLLGHGAYIEELAAEAITEADLALYTEVPEDVCAERDIDPASADYYGILWDPERKLWITPIREPFTDRLVGWQEKNKRHFNNHPEHLEKSEYLFGFNQAREFDTCVLVEAPLDTARVHTAGVDGCVASMGAFLSDAQLELIVRNFDCLVSAQDNDEAGDKVNASLRRRVNNRIRLRFWNYADLDVKDPGEQTDMEIRESYKTAYSALLARF